MKKIILIFTLLVSTLTFAQEQVKLVSIPENQLTEQQKAQIKTDETIETVGRWTGLGKEVGTAMNDGLSALTTQAELFSKTDVGKFTMFMIAWKVMGNDFIQLMIGSFLFLFFVTAYCIVIYRCRSRRVLVKESVDTKEKFYENEPCDWERMGWSTLIFMICMALNMAVIFS